MIAVDLETATVVLLTRIFQQRDSFAFHKGMAEQI